MRKISKFILVFLLIFASNIIFFDREVDDNINIQHWTVENIGLLPINSHTVSLQSKQNHVFVTLGLKLKNNGDLQQEAINRLQITLKAFNNNKKSYIIVSGGNPKAKMTEAKAMKIWLQKHGVPKNKIIEESSSKNTIENALYSMNIINKKSFKSITLITSDSHMRRAYILFKNIDSKNILCSNLVPYTKASSKIYSNQERAAIENNLKRMNSYKEKNIIF